MAEHEEGFVLTTVDSIMNSIRRTVGAKTVDIAAPVVNWARKSALWPMTFGSESTTEERPWLPAAATVTP